jgi:hypothetical protein
MSWIALFSCNYLFLITKDLKQKIMRKLGVTLLMTLCFSMSFGQGRDTVSKEENPNWEERKSWT